MRAGRAVVDRYLELIEHRVAPTLTAAGFVPLDDDLLACELGDVTWLVAVELAPWTTEERLSFTLAWGVAVPRLEAVLGNDEDDLPSTPAGCPIAGRLGERANGVDAAWMTIGPVRVPGLERAADVRTAQTFARLLSGELLPTLQLLDSIPAVQAHLVSNLVRGRGAAANGELKSIRWIAGLSLLLGARDNASRWLDYLEARSSASIAPDVVSERMAPLRQRCAS